MHFQRHHIHPLPVPPALLVRDIGGLGGAQDVRKVNFLRQGVSFVRKLIEDIDPTLLSDAPRAVPGNKRESGAISFDAEGFHLHLLEDATTRQGLILHVSVKRPDGSDQLYLTRAIHTLNEPGAWEHHTELLKKALRDSKRQQH